MRIDKYLKTARILKRREAAKQLALEKRIWINGRQAKPGSEVEEGDVIKMAFGNRILEVRVEQIKKQASKADAALLFTVLHEERIEQKPIRNGQTEPEAVLLEEQTIRNDSDKN